MTLVRAVDLDRHEEKKLQLLMHERVPAQFASFALVLLCALVAISIYLLVEDIRQYRAHPTDRSWASLRSSLSRMVEMVLVAAMVAVAVLHSRSITQMKMRSMWTAIGLVAVVGGSFVVYVYFAMWSPGIGEPLLRFFLNIFKAATSHWAGIVELILVFLFIRGIFGPMRVAPSVRVFANISDEDKLFLREESDDRLSGRTFRSLFGVPRIVDFMARRRRSTTLLFFAANAIYAISLLSMVLYVGLFGYHYFPTAMECTEREIGECIAADPIPYLGYTIVLILSGFFLFPLVGGFLAGLARRNIRFSVTELLKTDERQPVLFLRSFRDDAVQLRRPKTQLMVRVGKWLASTSNLDQILLEEGTPYGPVVAIGNPKDPAPPYYRIAREYFDDETWKEAVSRLAEQAAAIVICVDDTEGIWWEVENVAARHIGKTLFLIHPKYGKASDNAGVVKALAARLAAATRKTGDLGFGELDKLADKPLLGMHFGEGSGLSAATSSTFSGLAFLLEVRGFLRSKRGYVS
ncbi:MAG: hypothetical protein F9K29_23845 [Hyphomicrobiaceae bacterium]|nr:MAG: hypothetical protein F9K29_23845 [Hyphomicrobiaceae bacterium]